MTWTRVSSCLLCASISWFTCCLISHVSLVVPLPVSHFNVLPKRGKRLLLDQEFLCGDMLSESVLSSYTSDLMAGL